MRKNAGNKWQTTAQILKGIGRGLGAGWEVAKYPLVKVPLTTYGLTKLYQWKPVGDFVRESANTIGRDMGKSLVQGADAQVRPTIQRVKGELNDIFEVDQDKQKKRLEAMDTIAKKLQNASTITGKHLGRGISSIFAPAVTSLGVAGVGAGTAGMGAYYLARKITTNRLLRTLITLAGAGAGGVLGNWAAQKYVVPTLHSDVKVGGSKSTEESAESSKDKDSSTDSKNTTKPTKESGNDKKEHSQDTAKQ